MYEFREKIGLFAFGRGLGGGKDGAFGRCGVALLYPISCEFGNGEGTVYEPVFSKQKPDRVFIEEEVEERNLSNLEKISIGFDFRRFGAAAVCRREAYRSSIIE